jgi:hypothetical protein
MQLGLADLTSFRAELAGARGYAVYPEVAPLFAVVDTDLAVEFVSRDALGIHFMNDGRFACTGNYNKSFVR